MRHLFSIYHQIRSTLATAVRGYSLRQSHQPANDLLAEKQSDLRYLEKVAARYGYEERFDILLQVEAVRQDIAVLEQMVRTVAAPSPASEAAHASTILARQPLPIERDALTQQITKNLITLQQALGVVADELISLPEPAQAAARRLVDAAHGAYQHTTRVCEQLRTDQAAPDHALRALLHAIWQAQAMIHPLELRQIHRRRFSIMEQQRVAHHFMLPIGDLRQSIEQSIVEEQRAIAAREQKTSITPHDTTMLAIHRQNLTWYQEIVTGQRPYTPVGLLRQIQSTAADIKGIDDQLAGAGKYRSPET